MLKKLFPVLMALSSILPINAQTYNMTTSDVTVESGGDAVITVSLDNSVAIRDMQLYLTLPENVVVPKDEYNEYQIAIDPTRNPKHTPTCNYDAGMFKMAIASVTGREIEAGSGPVAYITIHADCAVGVYSFSFSEVHLSRIDDGNNAVDIPIADFGATLTVTAAEEKRYGDNQLYAKDVTINEGENAQLLIGYNSLTDLHEYAADITLPEGVSVTNVEYYEVLTSQSYTTDWSFANGVLYLTGEQSGTAKKPKPSEAGDHLFACVSLGTSTIAAGTYNITIGNQYISNEDDDEDGEHHPESYTAVMTIKGALTPLVQEITDGEAYTAIKDKDDIEVSYTRTFNNTEWQPLYVPFNMSYDEWSPYADVAELYNVRGYDKNEDGVIDDIAIEFNKLTSGEIVPNIPYVIRAKATGPVTFECYGKTVLAAPAEEGTVSCSSTKMTYSFHGIYQEKTDLFATGAYHLSGGAFHQAVSDAAVLSPNRFYLEVTPKVGGYTPSLMPKKIRLVVNGDDTVTGTEEMMIDTENDGIYYDLTGRQVTNPAGGIYIRNGKKVVIK